jgi:hypothetical protein
MNQMSNNKKTILHDEAVKGIKSDTKSKTTLPSDEVVQEILKKAREDNVYKKMLCDNPKEALGQFDVTMPDVCGEDHHGRIYSMYDRGEFYKWFYKSILNELRDETETTRHEDVDWHNSANYEFYWH